MQALEIYYSADKLEIKRFMKWNPVTLPWNSPFI